MQTMTSMKNQHAQKIADELTHFLADTYALYLKTQNFHWNVTGPHFYHLHLLFEKQYQELAAATDVIAERIRALGSIVPASFAEFAKLSSIKDQAHAQPISSDEMLKKLLKDHETIVTHANHIFTKAEKAQDQSTMDLLIERMREHEQTAWMLRSSLK